MPFVKVREIDVYYEYEGQGPDVLLISGTGSDLRNPRFPSPAMKKYRVLRYDQRGLGQTSKPEGPYSMEGYADDAAALLDALNMGRVPVIGVSFGGMVAQNLAIRHPGCVDSLVLACTSAGGHSASTDLLALMALPSTERIQKWLTILDKRYVPGVSASRMPIMALLARALNSGSAIFPNLTSAGLMNQLEARSRHDVCDRLSQIQQRTLIVGGTYDGVSPPANLQLISDRIPRSELQFFEGGHAFLLQDSKAWGAIDDFLRAQDEGC
jgi:3-oxoadipate enol-lactonase